MITPPPPLIDTHCHIHDSEFKMDGPVALDRARSGGVQALVCVGTSLASSQQAVDFCKANRPDCSFSLALHPHEATNKDQPQLEADWQQLADLALSEAGNPQFVAIGECGLDQFYPVDSQGKKRQAWLLEQHLALAQELQKPVIFHVRDAFEDFWQLYDRFQPGGVVHSFSAGKNELLQILQRNKLYVGLNGIMTFTSDKNQLEAAKAVPLNKLLLETDAPFLTPNPLRGRINEPANVRLVAQFLSDLRSETESLVADQTTANAMHLFGI